MTKVELLRLEREVPQCRLFADCSSCANQRIELSRITAGDPLRGSHDARILIVTQSPDARSGVRRGAAYTGGTGTKIVRMFLRSEYGICVDYPDYGRRGVRFFLEKMRIYRTSAVKCVLTQPPEKLGAAVTTNCRAKFLDGQINLLSDLELILPMGRLAIASVMHKSFEAVDLREVIGRRGKGIIERDRFYAKAVIALPHPSGMNTEFNPPQIRPRDPQAVAMRKAAFARALEAVRSKLSDMGYTLRPVTRIETGPLDMLEHEGS